MGYREVLEAVKPTFNAVIARASIATVDWDYGARAISNPGKPPRVIWVPWHAKFGPPARAASPAVVNPRPLHSTAAVVAAHVWGVDESACEQLISAVLQAMNDAIPGAFKPVLIDWTVGETTSKLSNGVLAVVHIELGLPIVRELDATVIINGFTITPEVLP